MLPGRKLDIDTSDISVECAHQVGEKKNGQERQIAVQFNAVMKINILRLFDTLPNFISKTSETKFDY